MRTTPWVLLVLALPGCYSFHGTSDTPPPVDPTPTVPDGGSPRPHEPGTVPPDASVFVPDDVEVPIERPREELTCDGGDEALIALCGALPIVHLATDGRAGGRGTASEPFGTFADAMAACAHGCELRIEQGEIVPVAPPLDACMWISGGWVRDASGWSASDARTILRGRGEGELFTTRSRVLIERVSIRDVQTAISAVEPSDLLVVRDADIEATYSGISSSGTTGTRICRTRIVADHTGINLTWGASDAVIEDVEIDAGYSGVDIGWESSSVVIRGSTIRGGYVGVSISRESHDVVIDDSTVDGGYNGVGVSWESSHVLVTDSTVGGCYEPVGVDQGAHTVKVTQSVTGECTGGPYEE